MYNRISTCFDNHGANVCLFYALQGFINVPCNLFSTHTHWFTAPMSYTSAEHATCFYYKYEQVCVSYFIQEISITLNSYLFVKNSWKNLQKFLGGKKNIHIFILWTLVTIQQLP